MILKLHNEFLDSLKEKRLSDVSIVINICFFKIAIKFSVSWQTLHLFHILKL